MKTNIIFFWICFIFFSCGTRKVETHIEKMQTKDLITTNSDITSNLDIRKYIYTYSDDLEFVPIDKSKPMVINGKSYLNAKIKRNKATSTDTSKTVATKIDKTVIQEKKETTTKTKTKNSERETKWGLIVLAIVVVVVVAVYMRSKSIV